MILVTLYGSWLGDLESDGADMLGAFFTVDPKATEMDIPVPHEKMVRRIVVTVTNPEGT